MPAILLDNALVATLSEPGDYGLVEAGAVLVEDGRIAWTGPRRQLPADRAVDLESIDCGGRLLTPGLVDCHTHLVYGGSRADEFELRLTGVGYEEIARRGGGIAGTVRATRELDEDALVDTARPRLARLLEEGVTTVEIKSGYGLDAETEIRMLRAAPRLAAEADIGLQATFLAAHALPPEYAGRADDYIDAVCEEMLPKAVEAGVVDAVDAFCEGIGFNTMQVGRVFDAAARFGLPVKCHAEQLSDLGGAAMAARRGALSVDHLEYLASDDAAVLAEHGTVAVLLPGAFYVLRETRMPPVDALREHRVPMALASDCNPGSSPVTSLLLMLNMACTLFRLTPAEALSGVTLNAARALGMADRIGSIEAGKQADLVLWDVASPAELCYRIGFNPCLGAMRAGRWRKVPEFSA